ncbi:MAG: hypothetical protein AB1745_21355, partial [Pseudomonadota bacterium]
ERDGRTDARASPVMMMVAPPMGRSRRNRSDEERCCRGDCKSKLSHLTSLDSAPAQRAGFSILCMSFVWPDAWPGSIRT